MKAENFIGLYESFLFESVADDQKKKVHTVVDATYKVAQELIKSAYTQQSVDKSAALFDPKQNALAIGSFRQALIDIVGKVPGDIKESRQYFYEDDSSSSDVDRHLANLASVVKKIETIADNKIDQIMSTGEHKSGDLFFAADSPAMAMSVIISAINEVGSSAVSESYVRLYEADDSALPWSKGASAVWSTLLKRHGNSKIAMSILNRMSGRVKDRSKTSVITNIKNTQSRATAAAAPKAASADSSNEVPLSHEKIMSTPTPELSGKDLNTKEKGKIKKGIDAAKSFVQKHKRTAAIVGSVAVGAGVTLAMGGLGVAAGLLIAKGTISAMGVTSGGTGILGALGTGVSYLTALKGSQIAIGTAGLFIGGGIAAGVGAAEDVGKALGAYKPESPEKNY